MVPRLPAQLILTWWNHLQAQGQDPHVLLAGSDLHIDQIRGNGATVEWSEFARVMARFSRQSLIGGPSVGWVINHW